MKRLIRGIVDFRKKVRPGYRETFARLALGQSPDALLIACSDSRVAPNLFASTEPGDLFVIRNPGNIIAPCGEGGRSMADESEGAAIEFSILALNVSDIIVCGHSECGAMRLLAEEKPPAYPAPHLQAWLRHAEGALRRVKAGETLKAELPIHNHVSQFNVLQQLENLRTYPSVRDRLATGRLRLHAWWFDIAQAEVLAYEAQSGQFIIIDDDEAERIIARLDGK
ncbi:MAG TPA: carbonic anhydrase [Planctomycetota bacterium]|jgi:carbonic anhydrase|nr:carbonic anhydrase [Planctomycetota bacterium]